MTSLIEHILSLSGWLALLIVFAVPFLESSVFLGFFFPGETALILGGVLASYHRVALWQVLVAGIAGAVLGDSTGYLVGREYGRRLLESRPLRRFAKPGRIDRGQDYLNQRGGKAVFLGRFTAALRVLVPGLAGMARMPYRVFLPWNVAGGATWGAAMVLLGYLAGASWKRVAGYATQVGIALFVVVVAALVTGHLIRSAREPDSWAGRLARRLAASGPAGWLERRFPGQLRSLGRRFQPGVPTGFAMTVAVLTLVACAWSLGSLTDSVLHHDHSARLDPGVLRLVTAHRTAWLASLARAVTWPWVRLRAVAGGDRGRGGPGGRAASRSRRSCRLPRWPGRPAGRCWPRPRSHGAGPPRGTGWLAWTGGPTRRSMPPGAGHLGNSAISGTSLAARD